MAEDMEVQLSLQLLVASLMVMMNGMKTAAASEPNFCSNRTVLRTQTACHSCSISLLVPCPSGFKKSPKSTTTDCKYNIKTASMTLAISGCSFECYRELEMKRCCPGYWGPDCIECPDQAATPCSGRGRCSDGLGGTGTCSCQVGFAGTACEDCAPGRYGPTCSSECSCVHGLCDSGLKGDGRCTCFSQYKGPNCDQEIPECAALSCEQNSRCMEEALTGKLVCQCLPGYEKSGSQCISTNPCLQRICHAHASCVHTGPNQHLCACHEGYSGDGRVCMAVDPCQTKNGGCSPGSARCVYDGPGKSHCECLPGYENLSAGGCSLRDACRPGSCHKNANCSTPGPGRVECTCLQGYIGNGKVCYGNIVERLNELNTEPGGQWSGQLSSAISLFSSLVFPLMNLGPFTVFVPINKGFRGLSVRTLTADTSKAKYLCKIHLVAGVMSSDSLKKSDVFYTLTGKSAEVDTSDGDTQPKIRIHGSRKKGTIVQSDIVASNGMIHIINKLMDGVSASVESNTGENLRKIISDNGKFETFKSLLEKTDLASVMDTPGPITVFAPTTVAFDTMAEGHLEFLRSADGHNKLLELLRNHVVSSAALEVFNVVSSPRIVTKANQILTINVTENGQILVNGAAVLESAVEANNGRLYVMDGVLTPPSIVPVLPHRCDITETKIIQGECGSCSKVNLLSCPSGAITDTRTPVRQRTPTIGCVYTFSFGHPTIKLPVRGCALLCNATVTTPACCKGFYGPDCTPCPGGFQSSCSGHGKCMEGIAGNGSCICEANFRGSRCQYCSSSDKYGPNCDRTCPCIHGECDSRPNSDGRCKVFSCQPGYTGRFCERRTSACGAQAQFCHAHADCDFSQGTARCVCKHGFQGDGITCVEADSCAPPLRGGCGVNAKCIRTGPGTHSCQCLTGWDTGMMDLVSDSMNYPVTIFLPSDDVMAALPQEQKDFLFHQHNRPQLLEYLKYHILHSQRVYAEDLIYLDSARTMQGSVLSFSCGGSENIGEIFINNGKCRIVQRHLVFRTGIAYGIDCLLTPPSLGGRCDEQTTFDLQMDCGPCTFTGPMCPKASKWKEMKTCDFPTMSVSEHTGCRPVCSIKVWKPKCCHGYYGRDCLVCPGGVRSPCSNRGKCDDGHLGNGTCACDAGFGGTACELCSAGFFGPTCKACNCSARGSCDDGQKGTGLCFCEDGWTGPRCDVQQTEVFQCSPPCSPKAVCKENNTCVCRPFYVGDGFTCTVAEMCSIWNGGCAKVAECSQKEEKVSCTCPKDFSGDGFTCLPIDPCASGVNGGCHEHATCTMTDPGKKKCTCKDNYLGDGVTCEVKQLPISRCLQDNGQCHPDAKCTDLHFEDATLGVFHYRSDKGQYKLNYTAAQQACAAEGGSLATYTQLSYAQQSGLNLCSAGWLDQAQVAYPTTYSNPNCGLGHVGIVDYGIRKNLSETWDSFCFRMKEVKCECKAGYVGDGFSCAGNLLQVLTSTPTFSNFLTQILNYSAVSESGQQFLKRLGNLAAQSTLFVPDNSGFPNNLTLSQRDIEFHLSEGQALPLSQLKNGSRIRTRVGGLTVLGVADLLNPSALSSRYINDRFVIDSDIMASNGIIHVLQGPLEAPPPHHQMQVAHRAGMGVGVVLLIVLVTGIVFVGYHFYRRNTKPFQFHYFKEDARDDEEATAANCSRSICNPVYEESLEPTQSDTPAVKVEDKHEVVNGGAYDLLQDS
ncbi:stabilin-2 [Leuresthes tenuis]|uniref:stabilin-2 n=1 Tax=Leuresthes tenuis TaxID=355514 RepID=UPI003B507CA1